MATKTLAQKLLIRPGTALALLNAPSGVDETLAPLPQGANLEHDPSGRFPLVLLFAQNQAELDAGVDRALDLLAEDAILWVAYPKKTSKLNSDLNRDKGWASLMGKGYRAIAQVALDETWTATRFRPEVEQSSAVVIAAQFAGAKAALRPLYDQVAKAILQLGGDVEVIPRQSYIAFARGRNFAHVRAATRDRLEVGLKLPDPAANPRLQPLRAGGPSMTHKVDLGVDDSLDPELLAWLGDAYRAAG